MMIDRACGLAGLLPRIVAESMDFAVQLELTSPVARSIHLAARTPDFADPGIQNLASLITEAAATRVIGVRSGVGSPILSQYDSLVIRSPR